MFNNNKLIDYLNDNELCCVAVYPTAVTFLNNNQYSKQFLDEAEKDPVSLLEAIGLNNAAINEYMDERTNIRGDYGDYSDIIQFIRDIHGDCVFVKIKRIKDENESLMDIDENSDDLGYIKWFSYVDDASLLENIKQWHENYIDKKGMTDLEYTTWQDVQNETLQDMQNETWKDTQDEPFF